MVDIKGTIEAGKGGFERLVNSIPGYRGYKDKEVRRDADKILRMYVAERFEEQRKRLVDAQLQFVSSGRLELLDDLDRAIQKLHILIDRIKTASYGYAGFFDAVKVKEPELDALYEFDNAMLNHAGKVSESVDALNAATASGENVPAAIAQCVSVVQDANYTFGHREEVILQGTTPAAPVQ